MSCKRNHAKRSHRSEHAMRSAIGASARKMRIRESQKPKRGGFLQRLKTLFHRKTAAV